MSEDDSPEEAAEEVVEEEEINPYGTGNYSYHDEDETEEMIGHT